MKVNHSSVNLPFSIVCSKVSGNDFEFMINFGSINEFIFSTYKRLAKPFSTTWATDLVTDVIENESSYVDTLLKQEAAGIIASSAMRGDKFIYKLAEKLQTTFTVSASCSVYLTIPKIPAGFDYYMRTSTIPNGKSKWWLQYRYNFLNQFKIETSLDEGFENRLLENQNNIEKNNPFAKYFSQLEVDLNQNLSDEDYPGKFYIKLADIIIEDSSYTINYFFRSNLIAPIRWVRLTAPQRTIACLVEVCAIKKEETGDSFFNSLFTVNHPRFLLKTLEEIKTEAEVIMQDFMEALYEGTTPELTEVTVYRVFLIYLEQANSETIIEVLKDDVASYNALVKEFKDALGDDAVFIDLPEKSKITEEEIKEMLFLEDGDEFFQIKMEES